MSTCHVSGHGFRPHGQYHWFQVTVVCLGLAAASIKKWVPCTSFKVLFVEETKNKSFHCSRCSPQDFRRSFWLPVSQDFRRFFWFPVSQDLDELFWFPVSQDLDICLFVGFQPGFRRCKTSAFQ